LRDVPTCYKYLHTQRKAPAMSKHKNPRSFDRPPLTALSNIFMLLTYLSAFATVAAAIVALFIADPVGMVVALSMFGSAIACGLAWTVVYIARTLDDIGYAVGAPSDSFPLPPVHATNRN